MEGQSLTQPLPVGSAPVRSGMRVTRATPTAGAVLALLKPITWFPPMWAFACGAVSSGVDLGERWVPLALGIVLAGPLLCGASQAVNDWFDRHVDAVNEPDRVIPSGRMPGRWGLWIAIVTSAICVPVAVALGPWVAVSALFGLALAWAYSAPPLRLKRDGHVGPVACALAYEGLPWFAAAAAALGTLPSGPIIAAAGLYAFGAIGIMTLNDFKAVEGDRLHRLASLPVRYGVRPAVLIACALMGTAQLAVAALLLWLGAAGHAGVVGALLLAQVACMVRLVRDPARFAGWYNAVGTGLYVAGMMVCALALGAFA